MGFWLTVNPPLFLLSLPPTARGITMTPKHCRLRYPSWPRSPPPFVTEVTRYVQKLRYRGYYVKQPPKTCCLLFSVRPAIFQQWLLEAQIMHFSRLLKRRFRFISCHLCVYYLPRCCNPHILKTHTWLIEIINCASCLQASRQKVQSWGM